MGVGKLQRLDAVQKRQTQGRLFDWEEYTSGGLFTTTAGGSATAVAAGTCGLLTMSAIDSTLNREIYVATTNSLFLYRANLAIEIETLIQYNEAATNKAIIGFGLMSSVGAASMQDTTGEPKTNFSGAVIYKIAGGTQWKTASSIGTMQTVNQSDTNCTLANTAPGCRLKIVIEPITSTLAEVTYYVNDVQLKTSGGRPGTSLIKDQVTYTGAVNMQLFHCLKNGSTSPEIAVIDYTAWQQDRVQNAA